MNNTTKYIIGVMSGTSLDGLDIVYVKINAAENYSFEILKAETISYSNEWKSTLREGLQLIPFCY
jgi:anhydro-N-acetylmuramic acid kinase